MMEVEQNGTSNLVPDLFQMGKGSWFSMGI